MTDLAYLLPHATTDKQRATIQAVIDCGSIRAAARHLGKDEKTVRQVVNLLRSRAGAHGSVPELGIDKPFPNTGNIAKGYSRYFKADDGGFWIKTDVPLSQRLAIAEASIAAMKEDIKPLKPIKLDRKHAQPDDLCNVYFLTDIHIGALSWAKETGEDWDISIAEQTVTDAFRFLIEQSQDASRGVFCQLGDALHYDSMRAETPAHRHHVDADSRPQKMVEATIRIFRNCVEALARKHSRVTVLHAAGNHDPFGSAWLQESFAAMYEDNPRIEVIRNPSPYYAITHGKTFLGFHHGHRSKMARLLDVFNSRSYWDQKANCRMAYIHSGHEHHREVKEFAGGICEMHQTLCARSSYEAHAGYHADRSMACVTYHTKGRELSRVTYYPDD
jgi:hypothetical protein